MDPGIGGNSGPVSDTYVYDKVHKHITYSGVLTKTIPFPSRPTPEQMPKMTRSFFWYLVFWLSIFISFFSKNLILTNRVYIYKYVPLNTICWRLYSSLSHTFVNDICDNTSSDYCMEEANSSRNIYLNSRNTKRKN